eukprot:2975657-Amphidinium_carterae.1
MSPNMTWVRTENSVWNMPPGVRSRDRGQTLCIHNPDRLGGKYLAPGWPQRVVSIIVCHVQAVATY